VTILDFRFWILVKIEMRIIIIGGNGTIGKKVAAYLSQKHEVLVAGRTGGDLTVDIGDKGSIGAMFEAVENIDAVVCIAGAAKWDRFEHLSEEDFYIGIRSKLMGQVNLVRIGSEFLGENGSITLTTGILADDPVLMTSAAALVNGGIHSFVRAVALELKRGIRINAVSSGLVEDAVEKYRDYFPGHNPVPMQKVINGYVRSIEGRATGEIIRIYE
jgi:NAD(P)-dependent dehydrogenase (short-subunit alcohol dehydrogenase family)